MKTFRQTRFFSTKKIDFKEKGIQYFTGNFLNSKSIFIPYEEIETENFNKEFKTDKINFFIALISLSFLIKSVFHVLSDERSPWFGIMLISSIFFIIFLIATILSRTNILYINTYSGFAFELFDNNPDEKKMIEFLTSLKNQTFFYLKNTYAVVDSDLSSERQLEVLQNLKQRKIITSDEYEDLKQKINLNKII